VTVLDRGTISSWQFSKTSFRGFYKSHLSCLRSTILFQLLLIAESYFFSINLYW